MVENINGLGRRIEVIAFEPLQSFLDPSNNRIAVATQLMDGSELRLWMTVQQFQQSLPQLKSSAKKLGVTWP